MFEFEPFKVVAHRGRRRRFRMNTNVRPIMHFDQVHSIGKRGLKGFVDSKSFFRVKIDS